MKIRNSDASIDNSILIAVVLLLFYLRFVDSTKTNAENSEQAHVKSLRNAITNKIRIEKSLQRRIEEEIRRKIDAIKSEIKREIEKRERIRLIEENNAKYDELRKNERFEKINEDSENYEIQNNGDNLNENVFQNSKESGEVINVESDIVTDLDEKVRKKRDKNPDDIKNIFKEELDNKTINNDNKISKKSLASNSFQESYLFPNENLKFDEPPANRLIRSKNAPRKLGTSLKLRRKRRRENQMAGRKKKGRKNIQHAKVKSSKNNLASVYDESFSNIEPSLNNYALWRFKRV